MSAESLEKLSVQDRIARLKQNKAEIYSSAKKPSPLIKAKSEMLPPATPPSSTSGSAKGASGGISVIASSSGSAKAGSSGIAKKLAGYRASSTSTGLTIDSTSSAFVKPSPKTTAASTFTSSTPPVSAKSAAAAAGGGRGGTSSSKNITPAASRDADDVEPPTENSDPSSAAAKRLSIADRIASFNNNSGTKPATSAGDSKRPVQLQKAASVGPGSVKSSAMQQRIAELKSKGITDGSSSSATAMDDAVSSDSNNSSSSAVKKTPTAASAASTTTDAPPVQRTPSIAERIAALKRGDSSNNNSNNNRSDNGKPLASSSDDCDSRPVSVIRRDDSEGLQPAASYTAAVLAVKSIPLSPPETATSSSSTAATATASSGRAAAIETIMEEEETADEDNGFTHSNLSRPMVAASRNPPHSNPVEADKLAAEDGISIKQLLLESTAAATAPAIATDAAVESAAEGGEEEAEEQVDAAETVTAGTVDSITAEVSVSRAIDEETDDNNSSSEDKAASQMQQQQQQSSSEETAITAAVEAPTSSPVTIREGANRFESRTNKLREVPLPQLTAQEEADYFAAIFATSSAVAAAATPDCSKNPANIVGFSQTGKEPKIEVSSLQSAAGAVDFKGRTRQVQELHHHTAAIHCMKFSPCGSFLATAGKDREIMIWAVGALPASTASPSSTLSLPAGAATVAGAPVRAPSLKNIRIQQPTEAVAVADDKGAAATVEERQQPAAAVLYPDPYRIMLGHQADITDLAWNSAHFLVSASVDHTARVWHIAHENCIAQLDHDDTVSSVACLPYTTTTNTAASNAAAATGAFFVTGCFDRKVRVWNIYDGATCVHCFEAQDIVTSLCFRPDGGELCVGTSKGVIALYQADTATDPTTLRFSKELQGGKSTARITSVVYCSTAQGSGTGSAVLVAANDSSIRLLDVSSSKLLRRFQQEGNSSSSKMNIRAFTSSSGAHIISGAESGKVFIWRTAAGEETAAVEEPAPVSRSFFSCCTGGSSTVVTSFEHVEVIRGGAFAVADAVFVPHNAVQRYLQVAAAVTMQASSSNAATATAANVATEEKDSDDVKKSRYSTCLMVTADITGTMKVYAQLAPA